MRSSVGIARRVARGGDGDGAQDKDAYQRSFPSTVVIRPEPEAYAPCEVVERISTLICFGSQNSEEWEPQTAQKTQNSVTWTCGEQIRGVEEPSVAGVGGEQHQLTDAGDAAVMVGGQRWM
jgi:hypothetical protein